MEELISEQDIGESVWCDMCGDDYSKSDEKGGILFGSKAVCPKCTPRLEEGADKNGETSHIKGRCPEGVSFREWCITLRGGNNKIKIYSIK